ncbi:hypothetical protein F444_16000 [Phytophthora nicotianae P1976]|uniref:RxLR effector PexRD54 WY domain-containing protein n=1 Tax=Phytophthora nicotianae P1976 TaxID=1317066 RepID=A0A080ZJX6_PHYNI|nr:hypothetical protein F444_16000 [Phytophthora nicotianae P1976]
MRTYYIALLVGTLVARADAGSMAEPTSVAFELSVTTRSLVDQTNKGIKRFLRTLKTNAEADEERVFGVNLGFVDDFLESLSQSSQIRHMLNERTSAKDAYKVFKVDEVTDNILESAQWKQWASYIAKLNEKDPDESVAAAMTVAYGGDGVAQIVAKAMKNPNTKIAAEKLEDAQLTRWIKLDSNPAEIFKVLKLNEKTDDIFNSPQLGTWTSYLKKYNEKHPTKQVSEMSVFTKIYGEEDFVKLLASADDNTAVVKKFKDELVKRWLGEPTHPLNIFNNLKLNEAGDDLLANPVLTIWVKYMKAFNKEYPQAETTMIQTFTKSYGDEKLATMIQAATKVEETKDFAKNLQTAQFNQWMVDKKTPKDILGVLKLNSQTFTDNPSVDIWRAYNKAYTKEFPDAGFAFQPYQNEIFQIYRFRTSNSVRDRNRETQKRAGRIGKVPDLYDETLKYYAKKFICTHGWDFKARGRGDRTNHTVRGIGCKGQLNAALNRDKGVYTVRISKHQSTHNPSMGPDEYTCYAKTRKIESPGIKRVVRNAKNNLAYLKEVPSKPLQQKDVENMIAEMRRETYTSSDDVRVSQLLQDFGEGPGNAVRIFRDPTTSLTSCITFQTAHMRRMARMFAEAL